MNSIGLIQRMERFPSALELLLGTLDPDDAKWRPEAGAWSLVEIANHLADEEIEDFRTRLGLTLAGGDEDWPPLDPGAAITERRYAERDLAGTLALFRERRSESIAWLRGLEDPDWTLAHERPRLGRLTAADLLVSWAAHDALHLRQISRRLWQLANRDAPEASSDYAGSW